MNLTGHFASLGLPLLVAVAGCAGCATAINGRAQEIHFSSDPPGATVLVDGANVGATPISTKLTRRDSHSIRIEKQGYVPYEANLGSTSDDRWDAEVVPAVAFPPLLVLPLADYWLGGSSRVVPGEVSVHLLSAPAIPVASNAQTSSSPSSSAPDAN